MAETVRAFANRSFTAALLLFMPALAGLGCSDDDEPSGANAGAGGAPIAGAGAGGTVGAGSDGAGAGGAATGGVGDTGGASGAAGAAAGAGGSGGVGGGTGGAGGATGSDGGADSGEPSSETCTRDRLAAIVDLFFAALSNNDPSALTVSASVKITENGDEVALGEGLWEDAGEVSFTLSALDVVTCSSVSEAVVSEGSSKLPVGVRLRVEGAELTEIEMIVVRSGDYFVSSNTDLIIESGSNDWLSMEIVPEADRSTREELIKIVDDYFTFFPAGGCNFAGDCDRLENGFSPGGCALGLSCDTSGASSGGMDVSRHVIDVEAGIAAGFVMFAGSYTDFHMFKVYAGEVHGVHAVLAAADQSGWD